MRVAHEARSLIRGRAFTEGLVDTISDLFPLGRECWHKLRLIVHMTITHTTATNPIVLGAYNFIKQILLTTNKNETIIQSPGLGLYDVNWVLNGSEPIHDVNGGTTATTYDAIIDIPFSHGLLARKEDLALNSGRYSSVELQITYGTSADVFGAGSEGDAVITGTIDLILFRNKSAFEVTGRALFCPYIKHLPSYLLTRGWVDIERSKELFILGFIANVQDMAPSACFDPQANLAYSGVPADVLDDLTWRDDIMAYLHNLPMDFFREERSFYGNVDMADQARFVGRYPWFFMRDGTLKQGFYTGDKTEVRLENNVVALGTPTTPQVDVMLIGARQMRE